MNTAIESIVSDDYKYGFHYEDSSVFKTDKGLTEETVRAISAQKDEPEWMLEYRLRAYDAWSKSIRPTWGADLSELDLDDITYYARPEGESTTSWDDVPASIRETYDRIGIPEAEQQFLAGVGAQYDSEIVYHNMQQHLIDQGVLFLSPEEAVKEHPDIIKKYFGTIIPYNDNALASLNTAVWSGGSFIYVPPGVHVKVPLQAYFRINSEAFGQFERTLIIADKGSSVHYIEGCTAPVYTRDTLHSAVVEIIAHDDASVQYTTVQNWSGDVYNLVTKRAIAEKNARVVWVDGNIGSKRTMKYPSVMLMGDGAHGEVLSIAFAGADRETDSGGKMYHAASNTTSKIISKSISKDGGISSYRGHVKVDPGLMGVKSTVECDALLVDPESTSNTYPYMDIMSDDVTIQHEATVSKIEDEKLFYMMARGFTKEEATTMILNGFLDPLVKELPMEYAVEMNRLIELEMEGSVG